MGALKLTYGNLEDIPSIRDQYNQEVLPKTPYFFLKVQEKNKPTSKNGLNCFPFGMLLPGRNSSDDNYRYGFNGMEMDDEVRDSKGTSYTTEFRQYDPRVGRWLSIDPVTHHQYSPYSVEKQVAIIYLGTKGLLGDVPVNKIRDFEKDFLTQLERKHPNILANFKKGNLIDDELKTLEAFAAEIARGYKSQA